MSGEFLRGFRKLCFRTFSLFVKMIRLGFFLVGKMTFILFWEFEFLEVFQCTFNYRSRITSNKQKILQIMV